MMGIFLPSSEKMVGYLAKHLFGAGGLDAVKSALRKFKTVERVDASALAWAIVVGFIFLRAPVVTRRCIELGDRLVRHAKVDARVLKLKNILSHGARSILASTFLSNGSWAAGKWQGMPPSR